MAVQVRVLIHSDSMHMASAFIGSVFVPLDSGIHCCTSTICFCSGLLTFVAELCGHMLCGTQGCFLTSSSPLQNAICNELLATFG